MNVAQGAATGHDTIWIGDSPYLTLDTVRDIRNCNDALWINVAWFPSSLLSLKTPCGHCLGSCSLVHCLRSILLLHTLLDPPVYVWHYPHWQPRRGKFAPTYILTPHTPSLSWMSLVTTDLIVFVTSIADWGWTPYAWIMDLLECCELYRTTPFHNIFARRNPILGPLSGWSKSVDRILFRMGQSLI